MTRWLPLRLLAALLLLAAAQELLFFHTLLLPSKLPLAALLIGSWLRQRQRTRPSRPRTGQD